MLKTVVEPTEHSIQALIGMERRLEREEGRGEDITLARIVLMRHYAAYARSTVRRTGGSVTEMASLTDRHNLVPLGWAEGRCPSYD